MMRATTLKWGELRTAQPADMRTHRSVDFAYRLMTKLHERQTGQSKSNEQQMFWWHPEDHHLMK